MTRWIEILGSMGDDPAGIEGDLAGESFPAKPGGAPDVTREIGTGLLASSLLQVLALAGLMIINGSFDWLVVAMLVPAWFLVILLPIFVVLVAPWSWVFPWLAPLALISLAITAFRKLPTCRLRYAVATLFMCWWGYGFWFLFNIFTSI